MLAEPTAASAWNRCGRQRRRRRRRRQRRQEQRARSGFAIAWITLGALAAVAAVAYAGVVAYGAFVRQRVRSHPAPSVLSTVHVAHHTLACQLFPCMLAGIVPMTPCLGSDCGTPYWGTAASFTGLYQAAPLQAQGLATGCSSKTLSMVLRVQDAQYHELESVEVGGRAARPRAGAAEAVKIPFKGSRVQDAQYHELESVEVGGGPRGPALELQKPFGGAPDGRAGAAGAAGGGGPGDASAPAGDAPALQSSSKVDWALTVLLVHDTPGDLWLCREKQGGSLSAHLTCIGGGAFHSLLIASPGRVDYCIPVLRICNTCDSDVCPVQQQDMRTC